tara:strand:+ start:7844 stop:8032 length:189 start_codon:yes stop_codon:yes gene_type:complete
VIAGIAPCAREFDLHIILPARSRCSLNPELAVIISVIGMVTSASFAEKNIGLTSPYIIFFPY